MGHFGLAAKYYCHFTSPIRRYPDLQIHRIIKEYLKGELNEKRIEQLSKKMPEVAKQCSVTERKAQDAETETELLKKAEYMKDKINEEFEGIISGVISRGIFVQLSNTVEGFVSSSSLEDDFYAFEEENMRFIGERTHKCYTIGDKVSVRLIKVSVEERRIDFEFTENNEKN